jgi:hypothetical protein
LLPELTRHHSEVSYRTPAELQALVAHWAAPGNAAQRARLIRDLQREIAEHATTARLAQSVLEADRLASTAA